MFSRLLVTNLITNAGGRWHAGQTVRNMQTATLLASSKPPLKPTKFPSQMVRLLDKDGKFMSDKPLAEAIEFAHQHKCELVEADIVHHATKLKVYKCVPAKELVRLNKMHIDLVHETEGEKGTKNDSKKADTKKDASTWTPWKPRAMKPKNEHVVKMMSISPRAAEQDLVNKAKQIRDWIADRAEVRVTVSGINAQPRQLEEVFETLEKNLNCKHRILQKIVKGSMMRFQVHPLNARQQGGGQDASESNQSTDDLNASDPLLDENLRQELEELGGSSKK